jgi:hypothetical protein
MFSGFWQWLHDTSPGQATFIGSVFGFLALLGGAWANASFNRKRDDRLRREEQRGVATALRAELAGCRRALLTNAEKLKDPQAGTFLMPDLAHSIQIMPEMVSKFGLLDEETIDQVTNAYLAVEQHSEQLLLLYGARLVDPERVARLVDPERVSAGEAQPAGETRATAGRRLMLLSAERPRRELCSGQCRRTRCHWPRVDSQPVVQALAVDACCGPPASDDPQRIHGQR